MTALVGSRDASLEARKQRLLAEINASVPAGIDWKQGARDYLSQLIREEGAHNEAYHLIKPFIGGDDFRGFLDEMYRFLNIMSLSPLTGSSRVLDVGCGPGWICHYLGKLGITVVGIDISQELLDIAARRLAADPYPAMGVFRVKFALHDIEATPLAGEGDFDLAIFESTLHHFLDPISALENAAVSLKDDGLVVIAEGEAPGPDSPATVHYRYLMDKFHTLERPYTCAQLIEMLDIAGFAHYRFFEAVNGWVPRTERSAAEIAARVRSGTGNNYVVACRSAARIKALFGDDRAADPTPPAAPAANIDELLALPEERFVTEAYRCVLGRKPDQQGAAHFSSALSEGRMKRIDVLARLAFSPEGLRAKRRPRGLMTRLLLSKIPLAGGWIARSRQHRS